jgi:hypothetical protein
LSWVRMENLEHMDLLVRDKLVVCPRSVSSL